VLSPIVCGRDPLVHLAASLVSMRTQHGA
jgi:hypothetical protein